MRRIAAIFSTIAMLVVAGPATAQAPAAPLPTVRARIDSGVLVGVVHDNANVFRNIPFAAPPVGKLRWAPPQPVASWRGDREAALPGPSCPQPMNADDTPNSGGANGPISEDCLQLNVYAPKGAKQDTLMGLIDA